MTLLVKILFICSMICYAMAAEVPTANQKPGIQSRISEDQLEFALNDKRYLMRQLKCALGEAACDPVGRRLKSLAPLVLRGSCHQCSPDETRQVQRVLSHIQRNFPREWAKVIQQYAGV